MAKVNLSISKYKILKTGLLNQHYSGPQNTIFVFPSLNYSINLCFKKKELICLEGLNTQSTKQWKIIMLECWRETQVLKVGLKLPSNELCTYV